MNGIVDRLRAHKFWSQTDQGTDHYEHDPLMDEAADHIERLEAALLNAKGFLDTPVMRRSHNENEFYLAVMLSVRAALPPTKQGEPG